MIGYRVRSKVCRGEGRLPCSRTQHLKSSVQSCWKLRITGAQRGSDTATQEAAHAAHHTVTTQLPRAHAAGKGRHARHSLSEIGFRGLASGSVGRFILYRNEMTQHFEVHQVLRRPALAAAGLPRATTRGVPSWESSGREGAQGRSRRLLRASACQRRAWRTCLAWALLLTAAPQPPCRVRMPARRCLLSGRCSNSGRRCVHAASNECTNFSRNALLYWLAWDCPRGMCSNRDRGNGPAR